MGSKGQCPRCGYKFVIDHQHRHPPDADDLGTAPTIKIEREDSFDFDLGTPRIRWVDSNSFVVAMVGLLLLGIGIGATAWTASFESQPGWAIFPASFHRFLGHGALALVCTAFLMEALSRVSRFAYLQESMPFILSMGALSVFGSTLSGAFTMTGFNPLVWMSVVAAILVTGALGLSFHVAELDDRDRSNLLITIALSVGALIVVAYLAGAIPS
ncbi:hypothetical protein N8586_00365 [Verrucomicrobiales bacterium]|nr:hypothetical protein [Verrucomicrobiales bacterium]MDA7666049.1 hypothetical protein [bacterium]